MMGYAERSTTGNCPVCGHSVVASSPGDGVICYGCGTEEGSKAWGVAAEKKELKELLEQAESIIQEYAPGFDVWLGMAAIALRGGEEG